MRVGSWDCSSQKRLVVGLAISRNSISGRSRNSSRKLGLRATVTCRSVRFASRGSTVRIKVRPPPALAASELINRRIIGPQQESAVRRVRRSGGEKKKRRRRVRRRVQYPREQMPCSKKTHTDNIPPRTTNLPIQRVRDLQPPPRPAALPDVARFQLPASREKYGSQTVRPRAVIIRTATRQSLPPKPRWRDSCCHIRQSRRSSKQSCPW